MIPDGDRDRLLRSHRHFDGLRLARRCLDSRDTSRRQSNPEAWLTIQDKTGACRMSVPPDWKQDPKWPGHVLAPEQTETTLIAGTRRARSSMSDADQKALEVDKIFENSPDSLVLLLETNCGRRRKTKPHRVSRQRHT